MRKEMINKNQKGLPVDYLRDRPYRGELEATLQGKVPSWVVKETLDILEANNFMVVKKIEVVPCRTY